MLHLPTVVQVKVSFRHIPYYSVVHPSPNKGIYLWPHETFNRTQKQQQRPQGHYQMTIVDRVCPRRAMFNTMHATSMSCSCRSLTPNMKSIQGNLYRTYSLNLCLSYLESFFCNLPKPLLFKIYCSSLRQTRCRVNVK